MEDTILRRTWAEIDLGAIEHNYRVICEAAKAPVLCVVKADCYGHGAVQCAKTALNSGAEYLGVATVDEAIALPTDFSARIARNTQIYIQEETNICREVDPWAGSYYCLLYTSDAADE